MKEQVRSVINLSTTALVLLMIGEIFLVGSVLLTGAMGMGCCSGLIGLTAGVIMFILAIVLAIKIFDVANRSDENKTRWYVAGAVLIVNTVLFPFMAHIGLVLSLILFIYPLMDRHRKELIIRSIVIFVIGNILLVLGLVTLQFGTDTISFVIWGIALALLIISHSIHIHCNNRTLKTPEETYPKKTVKKGNKTSSPDSLKEPERKISPKRREVIEPGTVTTPVMVDRGKEGKPGVLRPPPGISEQDHR